MALLLHTHRECFANRRRVPSSALVAGWLALLVAEVLVVSLRFDLNTVASDGRWWTSLLAVTHNLPQALAAVVAAVVLLRRPARTDSNAPQAGIGLRFSWRLTLVHAALFAVFVMLTAMVLEGWRRPAALSLVLTATWLTSAGAVLLSWMACVLPPAAWVALARGSYGSLLAGVLVGVPAWGFAQLTEELWRPLGRSTLLVVRALLSLFAGEVVCEPGRFIIGTSSFQVEIAPACSGYEGIGLVTVLLAAYLWHCRQSLRFPVALLLVPLGVALIWLANAVRLAALIALGTWVSPSLALGGFHSQAGWLAFIAVGLGTVAISRRPPFCRDATFDGEAGRVSPTAAFLLPLLVLVAGTMVSAALNEGFDLVYPLRVVAVGATLWLLRRQYGGIGRKCSWQALAFGAAAFAIWMALEPVSSRAGDAPARPAELAQLPSALAVGWVLCRVVGSVITVPIAEELAFRGYLTRRLMAVDFEKIPLGQMTWSSFFVSSALFGALHGRWLAGILAGMIYALALRRRGSLTDAVFAHATTNALIAVFVLATGDWSQWL